AARMLPLTWPSMRRPSANCRSPRMWVPCAIRLLMGGCLVLPNMASPGAVSQLGGLDRSHRAALQHLGGDGLDFKLRGQFNHPFLTEIRLHQYRLRCGCLLARPGLARQRTGEADLQRSAEFWRTARGLDHQNLPTPLRGRQTFGLQT